MDEDRFDATQRFSRRSTDAQQNKIQRTTQLRADQAEQRAAEPGAIPSELHEGEVIQVFSLYSEVADATRTYQCVVRKTLGKTRGTAIVVGDRVKFRLTKTHEEDQQPQTQAPEPSFAMAMSVDGVIEEVLPRATLLTRAESFKGTDQQPIVANAQQMLIVVALAEPSPKWGLIDRMLVAARAGGLEPILCLNKVDLAGEGLRARRAVAFADEAIAHYMAIGTTVVRTSVVRHDGMDELKRRLQGRSTVLSGSSGVGKSSLIGAIQPDLDLRIGQISAYTGKGRHTTTFARRYTLDFGGTVIDTPGVKLFGLWNVTPENLLEFFPDVKAGTAPAWRQESYQRLTESVMGGSSQ